MVKNALTYKALYWTYGFLIAFRIARSRITQQLFINRLCETAAATATTLRVHQKKKVMVRRKTCQKYNNIIVVLVVKHATDRRAKNTLCKSIDTPRANHRYITD